MGKMLLTMLGVFLVLVGSVRAFNFGIQSTYLWRGIEMMADDGEAYVGHWACSKKIAGINVTAEAEGVFNDEYAGDEWKLVFARFTLSGSKDFFGITWTPWVAAVHKNTEVLDDDDLEVGLKLSRSFDVSGITVAPYVSVYTDLKGDGRELDYTGVGFGMQVSKKMNYELPSGLKFTEVRAKGSLENVNFDLPGIDDYTYGSLGVEVDVSYKTNFKFTTFLEAQDTFAGDKVVKDLSVSNDNSNVVFGIRFGW